MANSALDEFVSASPETIARQKAPIAPGIVAIQTLLRDELLAVDAVLRAELNSDVPLIGQIGDYLIAAGGKRIRPMLVLLCTRALTGMNNAAASNIPVQLAAIVELIHTATLLHDDVVDESGQRRARKTANALWGNAPSVLVGDFLYSRAFQMMVRIASMPIMRVLADTTNTIAEGEVLQLMHRNNPEVSQARYLEVIRRKTAILFSAACQLAGIAAGTTSPQEQALAEFGLALGMAFQISDDVLDYVGDAASIGKNLGDDLAEGKATLPLILAQQRTDAESASRIRQMLERGERDALPELIQILRQSDAIDASFEVADQYAESAREALADFPNGEAKNALLELTRFAVRRSQ